MQLVWADQVARHAGGNVLILAPLAVSAQTAREGAKFGIDVTVCRTGTDVKPGINITNYERLHYFEGMEWSGLVLDECFASGTNVDVVIDGMFCRKHIENIRKGDRIINASGVDTVAAVRRTEVKYAVSVSIEGRKIVCSPNHPFFTRRGWVQARKLTCNDEVMATSTAVRMVREGFQGSLCASRQDKILRAILLSEMANESARISCEGAYAGSGYKTRGEEGGVAGIGQSEGKGGNRTHQTIESEPSSRGASENIEDVEGYAAQAERARGERSRRNGTATSITGSSGTGVDCGIPAISGEEDARLSDALQTRLSESQIESLHRSGRILSRFTEDTGREEGYEVGFARVDGVTVYESGDPRLDQYRDARGRLYFYDLRAARHPSFSVTGLLVHNSSILKSFEGTTRKQITDFAKRIGFRLACTATPAPNDLIELTNHAEFLSVMEGKEIIALYFTQDGNTTHKWRLKGHAREDFWKWLASWAVCIRKPSDLGFEDGKFILPPLNLHQVIVQPAKPPEGLLYTMEASTLAEQRAAARASLKERVAACAALVAAEPYEPWVIWCNLNAEGDALEKAIPGAVQVAGSDTMEFKEQAVMDFIQGKTKRLISKASIIGHGLNLQLCARTALVGLSHSYEQLYQLLRRFWRFGQTRPVEAHIIVSEADGPVLRNIERKEKQAAMVMENVTAHMRDLQMDKAIREEMPYAEATEAGDGWTMHLGDCVRVMDRIPDNSVGLSVFSPPFPGMYAYTNSPNDLGNTTTIDEMMRHFAFVIAPDKLLRILKPGRLACVHLMQLTSMKSREGYIGIKDYRGKTIEMFQQAGWVYAGEVLIDKNPQIQATRNKERGLLFKTLATDSSLMRMALADYLIYFRKPGDNAEPVRAGKSKKYNAGGGWITEDEWVEWAAPVWYRHVKKGAKTGIRYSLDDHGLPVGEFQSDGHPSMYQKHGGIRETDVLNVAQARETDDERHLCPLQLGVVERAVKLWSNPGDLVFSPFAGIGSEGVVSIRLQRRFEGIELKKSYWHTAVENMRKAQRATTVIETPLYAEQP